MCPWEPASVALELALAPAAFTLAQETRAYGATPAAGQTVDYSQQKPVRMIRDPYPAYSSVAVDPINNEVVLTDENLFQIFFLC